MKFIGYLNLTVYGSQGFIYDKKTRVIYDDIIYYLCSFLFSHLVLSAMYESLDLCHGMDINALKIDRVKGNKIKDTKKIIIIAILY